MAEDDDLFLMTLNPRNIIGVYNDCDRWCERCPFTDLCLLKASIGTFEVAKCQEPVEDPLIAHLKARCSAARAAMDRRWTGFDLPEEVFVEERDPVEELMERRRHEAHENHPIVREAHAYCGLVSAWFETESERLRGDADALAARAETDDLDDLPTPSEMSVVVAALEMIRHDQYLIAARLYRALSGRDFDKELAPRFTDPNQNDHNGSAKLIKVALLAMDRCEAEWRIIDKCFPSSGAAALLAGQIADLRVTVERECPDARRFLRAGFDGLVPDE